MSLEMRNVFSKRVSKIGWDDSTGELVVMWISGKFSRYAGVPKALANQVMNSASVGTALSTEIEGKYDHLPGY